MTAPLTPGAARFYRRLIAAAVGVAVVAGVLVWRLGGEEDLRYSAVLADASNLVPDNAVRLHNVDVGAITDIELEGLHAKVDFTVAPDVKLPAGTRVEVKETSLLGELFLALVPEGEGALPDGATIPIERTRRVPQLEQVVGLGGELVDQFTVQNLNKVVHAFDEAFATEPRRATRFIDAMAGAAAAFNENRADLEATIDRVEQMASSLAPHTEELAGSVQGFLEGVRALDNHKDKLAAFTEGLSRMSVVASELLTKNETKLSAAAAQARQVLDEIVTHLDDVEIGLQALPDFNNGWACTVQGHYIQFLAGVYPEVARLDTGAGHCDPEAGPRGQEQQGQVRLFPEMESQHIDDPAGTGQVDIGGGKADDGRLGPHGRPYDQPSEGYRYYRARGDDGGLGRFLWGMVL